MLINNIVDKIIFIICLACYGLRLKIRNQLVSFLKKYYKTTRFALLFYESENINTASGTCFTSSAASTPSLKAGLVKSLACEKNNEIWLGFEDNV